MEAFGQTPSQPAFDALRAAMRGADPDRRLRTVMLLISSCLQESTLHIDLAKSNSRSKRPRTDESTYSSDRRVRVSAAHSRDFRDSGNRSHSLLAAKNSCWVDHLILSAFSSLSPQCYLIMNQKLAYDSDHSKLTQHHEGFLHLSNNSSTHATETNPPCPTLFVSNLGPSCTEKELTQVFSRCPGFLKLKMQNKKSVPVAFVDFEDVKSSTAAFNHLQGTILDSSGRDGMRLEYAKTRMGLRKREKRSYEQLKSGDEFQHLLTARSFGP
ncbi:uncharacterized protein LOC141821466 [Curcuma longa]|uniref:uncharacterized protein LOC141821466 n=1 Tax=Curcuma longa TaxID=136217 RepID=UPI003D9F656E